MVLPIAASAALTQLNNLAAAFGGITGVLEVFGKAVGAVSAKFNESLRDTVKVDQRLAVINTSLEMAIVDNQEALEQSTAGLAEATKAFTELKVLGFQTTNKNLVDLATRLKVSGQNTAALFKVSEALLGVGGISEKAIDSFASDVTRLSTKFGVTADAIVRSVESLIDNIDALAVAGGAETSIAFATELTARLGQENQQLAARLVRQLTDPNINVNQAQMIGLESAINQLQTGQGNRDIFADIEMAGSRLAQRLEGVSLRERQALMEVYGEGANTLIRVAEELRQARAVTGGDKISELLSVITQDLLGPFNQAIQNMMPSFKYLLGGLTHFGTSILNFVAAFEPVLRLLFYIAGGFLNIVGAIINAIAMAVDLVAQIVNIATFGIFDMGIGGFDKVAEGIGKLHGVNSRSADALEGMLQNSDDEQTQRLLQVQTEADMNYLTARQLNIIDALGRNVEFEGLGELIKYAKESSASMARTARNTQGTSKAPSAGRSDER